MTGESDVPDELVDIAADRIGGIAGIADSPGYVRRKAEAVVAALLDSGKVVPAEMEWVDYRQACRDLRDEALTERNAAHHALDAELEYLRRRSEEAEHCEAMRAVADAARHLLDADNAHEVVEEDWDRLVHALAALDRDQT